ncbi:Exostosin-like [Macleaya cordata]|uniref:Exostosin-like n=1 Tax=Macleaya cordata TaxID=56857 RepID=A0A200R963_MACCD|nr:Exostosin-like [Macleaya cordata]
MRNTITVFFNFFLITSLSLIPSLLSLSSDPCNPKTLPDPKTLISDQITVLINGYSESRIHLLRSISATYSSSPSVAAVLILWGNPKTPLQTLTQFSQNLTSYFGGAPISILRQSTDSLNSRFLPRSSITTRAVAICDDDIEIDSESFEFAFKIWNSHQENLIGFFARSHDLDLSKKTWIYTVHPDKYSILLTKFMILKTDYLYKYSCSSSSNSKMPMPMPMPMMKEMRNLVDQMQNCEDILMNFVVADESNSGPILIESKRLRDHGDARNEEREGVSGEEGVERESLRRRRREKVREVGLSSRRREHRKRRGDCIREFHRLLGRMPLRYSYGKVVNSVGEQGLCLKGGKLVFCDEQIL